ncbi:kinase-like domain-containing protein, partial [Entophlyctis helioformis]
MAPSLPSSSTAAAPHSASTATPGHSLVSTLSATSLTPVEPVKETRHMVRDYDPQTGNKMINNYMMLGELGRGMHGKVKLCVDTDTGERWAIKIVEKHAKRRRGGDTALARNPQLEKIQREIAILKKCAHPHVVRLREVIDDPQSDKIYLVLEYLEGGDIVWQRTTVPALSVDEARSVFRDLVSGVQYLHYQGIVHRDIKPANLLWSGGEPRRVKISDFGVSVFVGRKRGNRKPRNPAADELELAKTAGSPAFFAPELTYAPPIGAPIDIWAMGVTLYCLVFGKVPFIADTEFELFNVIVRQPLLFP